MNEMFQPYLRRFVIVFFLWCFDIYSKNKEDHVIHLAIVLEILVAHILFAKKSKCKFWCKEIKYLGHLVSIEGVKANFLKIKSMINWPLPNSLKSLKGFLGLNGSLPYWRRIHSNGL